METKKEITVLGLGQMGVKLAELLLSNGYSVSVWNRTIAKASQLSGVKVIEDINHAVDENAIIVMCVYDYKAVNEVFQNIKDKTTLSEKTIINFTTASPTEAEDFENWLLHNNAKYISGAIQVAPDQMGFPETTIILSGNEEVYKTNQSIFNIFGGNIKYIGNKASLASTLDLATLSWLYGAYVGLMYAVGLSQKAGLKLELLSNTIAEITPGFTEFFKHEIGVIDKGDFTITQSPLAISITATQRIADAVGKYGLDTKFYNNIVAIFK